MAETDSRRINVLSRSKRLHPGFSEDRRSVYWIEKWPVMPAGGRTEFAVTPRLEQLAQHKNVHQRYNGDRPESPIIYKAFHKYANGPTPIWGVSDGAKNAEATPRLSDLARHREPHTEYLYHRSVYTDVPSEALQAEATLRLTYLSEPKPHKVHSNSQDTLREGEFSEPITSVTLPAITANCTPRVESLSEAKQNHDHFQPNRHVMWPVSRNAMNSQATTRLQQLARPKSGRLYKDDYDPYKVPASARLARPSPRVQELCEPLPRKQRQKKAV